MKDEGVVCEMLQAVRDNVNYSIDQCHMMPFVFGDFVEAVVYPLIVYARIL